MIDYSAPERHWARGVVEGPILEVIDGWSDPDLSYEFDITDVVRTPAGWYIVNTAGCSCPSYEEVASVFYGPDTPFALAVEYVKEYFSALHRKDEIAEVIKALQKAHSSDLLRSDLAAKVSSF